jgi:NAD(P)-dependent dehydrogenase (short-subunit alcohol dehydrogenase family)
MRLKDKVAVITGAGSGIGRESVLLFVKEGAKVVAADLNEKAAQAVAEQATGAGAGGACVAVKADVSKAADCENMVKVAEKAYGKLNVLFNNAGIMDSRDDTAETTDEAVWDLTMAVNLKSVFLGCKYGIPALRRAGGGSVINTASVVALMGSAAAQVAYTASKGGILSLSRELAAIHAREKIRVNALCPGPLRTELLMKFLDTDAKRNRRLVHLPQGRFGESAEIAKAALFLASDDASHVNGATFLVDGGLSSTYITAE